MRKLILKAFITVSMFLAAAPACLADIKDPFDPFSAADLAEDSVSDKDKSAEELAADATMLFRDERPLDARTKLLRALEKDPTYYNAHSLLAGYYMVHVGHFRLALKYVKQALDLFKKKNGEPPYLKYMTRLEHGHMLYLLSQVRLDLGDYQGALDALDEYSSLGYYDDWYPGSRAWVLMKLGRIDEAIKAARVGILSNAEPGRTMNILAILLSMTGNATGAVEVFKQTVAWEMSMGKEGQPATPLNNMGEVYREQFEEDKAESSWLRATSLPDGCEHVLSAINLGLLHLDDLNLDAAKRALDNFEGCFAQYPLKNGEEHRALVAMMRGRIALRAGKIEEALRFLNTALESRQWFGKIGTSEEDLKTGILTSLGQAEARMADSLSLKVHDSVVDWLNDRAKASLLRIKSFWHLRRARQILVEDLKSLEDIEVRNTDSMIEYAAFGETLKDLPPALLKARIDRQKESDKRPEARMYYSAWLAENYLNHGYKDEALSLIDEVMAGTRPQLDSAVKLRVMLLKLSTLPERSEQYARLARQVFLASPAELRNNGFKLPVRLEVGNEKINSVMEGSPFLTMNAGSADCSVKAGETPEGHQLVFNCPDSRKGTVKAEGKTRAEAVNNLSDKVFSVDIP